MSVRFKARALAVGFSLGMSLMTAGQTAPEVPTLTPQRIDDNRYGQLDPKYRSTGHTITSSILVKVSGLSFKPARAGDIKITEIQDDVGTDLLAMTKRDVPEMLTRLQRINGAGSDNSFTLSLIIGKSPRKATKLTSVKGEFTVIGGGEEKELTIASAGTLAGKAIENEDFAKMGLSVKVIEPPDYLKGQAINFEATGPVDAIVEIQVLSADGKMRSGSYGTSPPAAGKTATTLYVTQGKIEPTQSAVIKYVVNQQKVVMPINLKDVPLP